MEEIWCLVPEVSADVSTNHIDSAGHLLIFITVLIVHRILSCELVTLLLTFGISAIASLQPELVRLVHDPEHVLRAHISIAAAVCEWTGACDTIVSPALVSARVAVHEAKV